MRLRHITQVSFRSSELTNFNAWRKANADYASRLGPDDVVLLVSLTGNQLMFVHGFKAFEDGNGVTYSALYSERVRLAHGTWNPLMLTNYATSIGLKLDGLKRFEEYYKEIA